MIENFIKTAIIPPKDIPALTEAAKGQGRNVIILDATFVLPTSDENIINNFKNCRIPEARLLNLKQMCAPNCDIPNTLPPQNIFEECMSTLGITSSDIIIVYGQHGITMGPARVWWMLRGFGHKDVCVLDGGLPAWKNANFETQSGEANKPKRSQYHAETFDAHMITDMAAVIDISDNRRHPIIDARPAGRFDGTLAEPRAGMRSGHIPKSINIPCSYLVTSQGILKSPDDLRALFKNVGLDLNDQKEARIITTCGSGMTACALTLALHHLGHKNVCVYDGSWSEWGRDTSPTRVICNEQN